jgi:hypothetical protein
MFRAGFDKSGPKRRLNTANIVSISADKSVHTYYPLLPYHKLVFVEILQDGLFM